MKKMKKMKVEMKSSRKSVTECTRRDTGPGACRTGPVTFSFLLLSYSPKSEAEHSTGINALTLERHHEVTFRGH